MKKILVSIIVAVISAVIGFIGGVVLAIKKPETIEQIKDEIDKKATEPEKSDNDNKNDK